VNKRGDIHEQEALSSRHNKSMTKDEVLSKVRKLFELSNSPNENEAALAAAEAGTPRLEYRL
jgi:hypothetical protein